MVCEAVILFASQPWKDPLSAIIILNLLYTIKLSGPDESRSNLLHQFLRILKENVAGSGKEKPVHNRIFSWAILTRKRFPTRHTHADKKNGPAQYSSPGSPNQTWNIPAPDSPDTAGQSSHNPAWQNTSACQPLVTLWQDQIQVWIDQIRQSTYQVYTPLI